MMLPFHTCITLIPEYQFRIGEAVVSGRLIPLNVNVDDTAGPSAGIFAVHRLHRLHRRDPHVSTAGPKLGRRDIAPAARKYKSRLDNLGISPPQFSSKGCGDCKGQSGLLPHPTSWPEGYARDLFDSLGRPHPALRRFRMEHPAWRGGGKPTWTPTRCVPEAEVCLRPRIAGVLHLVAELGPEWYKRRTQPDFVSTRSPPAAPNTDAYSHPHNALPALSRFFPWRPAGLALSG
jgi:hypothetical protein